MKTFIVFSKHFPVIFLLTRENIMLFKKTLTLSMFLLVRIVLEELKSLLGINLYAFYHIDTIGSRIS